MTARRSRLSTACAVLLAACSVGAASEPPEELSADDLDLFESKIRPLLVEKCYGCHSAKAKKVKAGLLLDTRAGWIRGGDTGPAVIPGNLEESLLWVAVGYEDPDLQMPPKKKLGPGELAALRRWIERGAPDPRTGAPVVEKRDPTDEFDLEKRRKGHWAWEPVKSGRPPRVKDSRWPRDDIDRYNGP